ncbi:hypothetical protein I6A60_29550 [Frankia sp. AgB1.9]|nr:hypothetical protein [Frankia sp. AgW1.1]MBL7551974.1 hypothetical protein [Frankia sp. AgB1.9]MBL7623256.1 hypothetical protein [Frankia sp. AgB1.8]
MVSMLRKAVPLLVTTVALLVLLPSTALAADTTQYAINPTRGNGVAIPFEGYTDRHGNPVPISGAVGVDLVFGSNSNQYLPCQNFNPSTGTGDTFVNACQTPSSYATYTRFPVGGGLLFPHGYFMGNTQPDLVHGGMLTTNWGARATALSVEFYPQLDLDSVYVHPRFDVSRFDHYANGWSYSPAVGRITLATLADPGTTHFGGRLTDAGRPVAAGRARITIFGGEAHSSTGYRIASFAVVTSTGADHWDSGAMYAGGQQLYILDTVTHQQCIVDRPVITGAIDIDLARPGFGDAHARCTAV